MNFSTSKTPLEWIKTHLKSLEKGANIIPVTYSELQSLCQNNTIINGAIYSVSEVPYLATDDRLFALGCTNEKNPLYSFAKYIAVYYSATPYITTFSGVLSIEGERIDSWRKRTLTHTDWSDGLPTKSVEIVTLQPYEILESAFIYFEETLSPFTDGGTFVKLTLSDLYGATDGALTDEITVGTGGWIPPITAGINGSTVALYHPYIPSTLTGTKTLNLYVDNTTGANSLSAVTSGQITVYYKTSFI